MVRRGAALLLGAVGFGAVGLGVAGCSAEVSRSAEIFFSAQHHGTDPGDWPPVDEQMLAARSDEALADAQRAGTVPPDVAVRLLPNTVVLEVVASADSGAAAARAADAAVDELTSALNGTAHGLGPGQFVILRYAGG